MKVKILIPILAVVVVALAVLLLNHRRTVQEQARQIAALSNEWQRASIRISDLSQANNALEQELTNRQTLLLVLTNAHVQALATLAQTESNLSQTEDSLRLVREELAARETEIARLADRNQELDARALELNTALANLTEQIADTQARLAAAEGDKEFLQQELAGLMAQRAEMERQLNDLGFLRAQVAQLRAELNVSRRLAWIRQGLFSAGSKGASQLIQSGPAARRPAARPAARDLDIEIHADGTVLVVPPLINPPAGQ